MLAAVREHDSQGETKQADQENGSKMEQVSPTDDGSSSLRPEDGV
jgi:hypothetical protein